MLKSFLFILVTLLAYELRADSGDKYAIVFGGAGEPPGDSTIFDDGISHLATSLNSANYKTKVAYDGGHKASMQMVANAYGGAQPEFTKANAEGVIDDYISRIESGEIKSQSQILVAINTHGWRHLENNLHEVATSVGPDLDVASFEKLLKVAQQKQIHLAILDMSCYSGQTLALAQKYKNTCVVTSASASSFGFNDFADGLFKSLKSGHSLEESFLNSRKSSLNGFPQISTASGQFANTETDSLLRLQQDFETFLDHLQITETKGLTCTQIKPYNVRYSIDDMQKIFSNLRGVPKEDENRLVTALEDYKIQLITREQEEKNLDRTIMYKGRTYSLRFFLDVTTTLKNYERMAKIAPDPEETKRLKELLNDQDGLLRKQSELLNSQPDFKRAYARKLRPSEDTAPLTSIWSAERKIYDQIYQNSEKSNYIKKDACKKFIF